MNVLKQIFSPPRYENEEANRAASFLHTILLLAMMLSFLLAATDVLNHNSTLLTTFGGILVPLAAAYWLNRHNAVQSASYLTLISMLASVTVSIGLNHGIHDIGLIIYAFIMVVASFFLKRRGIFILTGIILLVIGALMLAETHDWLPRTEDIQVFSPTVAEFFSLMFIFLLGASAISVLAETMTGALQNARNSEQRWHTLVDNAPDPILILNPNGTILFTNQPATRYPNLRVGDSLIENISPQYWPQTRQAFEQALNGSACQVEIPLLDTGERLAWHSLRMGVGPKTDKNFDGVIVIATNIQARIDSQKAIAESQTTLQAQAKQLSTLHEIGKAISSLTDLKGTLQLILLEMKTTLPLDGFVVSLYDEQTRLHTFPLVYDDGNLWEETSRPLVEGTYLAQAILGRQAFIHCVGADPEEEQKTEPVVKISRLGSKRRSRSILVAPMIIHEQVIGTIAAHSYSMGVYTQEHVQLLSGAAIQIAIAIENARLYSQLQKELGERISAEQEVRELNASLEAHVRQRTQELENANQELASFAYAVSHDLRAPIRGIHGLGHILIEEYGEKLPPEGIAYIARMQAAAKQMGQLIDELLEFTHLGRHPVRKTRLDMNALVQTVVYELTRAENPKIDFQAAKLPPAYGDYALIRQALKNLIANAIKFSQKVPHPVIQIGAKSEGQQIIYFIRDNGAGFEMAYADKLFGIFQRLHRQDEFEGRGVGLAITKRIMDRHNGSIWAEAKTNQGATFYFSLPESEKEN